ncbi:tetratricopeptide repeat protein [Chitinophaga sp. YR627]|uniref:tetratricopeptide repeat protein n=1 Tax=Chitinophaga sp. YR627 TaxID=1881041 RepID=UPI002936F94F|nr:tetratricopeptide repeat protein [Chitinophaga sp. YR627]
MRGIAKGRMNDPKGGIADFTKAIELTPREAENYYHRGYLKMDLSQNKEAIPDFNKAIELNANYTEAFSEKGNANFLLKNYPEAIEAYTKAINLEPNGKNHYYRGISRMNTKDENGACQDFQEAEKQGYKIEDKAILSFVRRCAKGNGKTYIIN